MHILNKLKVELKAAVETEAARGPSEETFYKVWNQSERDQYIKDHPDSKFAQDKDSKKQNNDSIKKESNNEFNELVNLKKKINKLKKDYDKQMDVGNRLLAIDINKNLKRVIEKYNNIYDNANLTEDQKDKLTDLSVKRRYF